MSENEKVGEGGKIGHRPYSIGTLEVVDEELSHPHWKDLLCLL